MIEETCHKHRDYNVVQFCNVYLKTLLRLWKLHTINIFHVYNCEILFIIYYVIYAVSPGMKHVDPDLT